MRTMIFILICLVSSNGILLANDDDHEKTKVLTLSNGRYEEFFDQDSVERIGSVLYNVNSKKIIGFVEEETEQEVMKADITSRWLSTDPLAAKYPSISPYVFAANSPILIKDPDGRDLKIGGDLDLSLRDIQSLVPEKYRSQIRVVGDEIVFNDFSKLPADVQKYEGVSLINTMITSDRAYKYSVSDETVGRLRTTGASERISLINSSPTAQTSIVNLSVTKRTDLSDDSYGNDLPEKGFDGTVTILDGDFKRDNPDTKTGGFPYPRNNVVFHELLENYLRTEGNGGAGMDYGDKKGKGGAHEAASEKANNFSKEVNGKRDVYGGYTNGFEPKK